MYVTPPAMPHTVERVIEHAPREPAHVPPHVERTQVERHVEHYHPEPPPHVPHAPAESQVIERITERFLERPPEPTPTPHVRHTPAEPQVIERIHRADRGTAAGTDADAARPARAGRAAGD